MAEALGPLDGGADAVGWGGALEVEGVDDLFEGRGLVLDGAVLAADGEGAAQLDFGRVDLDVQR